MKLEINLDKINSVDLIHFCNMLAKRKNLDKDITNKISEIKKYLIIKYPWSVKYIEK